MSNVKELKYTRIRGVKSPTRSSSGSAGLDVYCPMDLTRIDMTKTFDITKCNIRVDTSIQSGYVTNIVISPGESCCLPLGIKMNIPEGYVLKIEDKSSVASRKGLVVSGGVLDSDYEGEIMVNLFNCTNKDSSVAKQAVICPGDAVCQLVLYPIETPTPVEVETAVDLFKNKHSSRGERGFGEMTKEVNSKS